MAKSNCDDCFYRVTIGADHACDYIFRTGHKHPCLPGEECTVKVRRKDIKRRGRRDKHVMELAEKNQQE